jgi:hypothetical protein
MIVGKDGFTVIGGGFLVAGIGDVNQDGIADCMISSYYNWQSKGNAYLMNYPRNMSSSPTFLPSSLPSTVPSTSPSSVPSVAATTYTPSNYPSGIITSPPVKGLPENESVSPSYSSTFKPTKLTAVPTAKKTSVPSLRTTSILPSLRPTVLPSACLTGHPISNPSYQPTISDTTKPSFLRTLEPSSNQTFSVDGSSFDFIIYDKPGEYTDTTNKNLVFVISAPGPYHIILRSPERTSNNNKNKEKEVKVLSLVPVYNQIIVDGFDALTDIIDLRKYPTIRSLEDLSYSTNPLIIKLPASLQPLFSLSSSSSGSGVTSQDKFSSTSESSPSLDSRSVQEQTITFTSFKNMKLFSERNFRFVPRTVPHRIGPVGSSEKAFQRLLVFGILILSVSVIFFFKCLREDIISEEKEELKEHEYNLQFTQIEIDNENQLEVIIVQNATTDAEEFPADVDCICSESSQSLSSSDDSNSQSASLVDFEKDENGKDSESDSLYSWSISDAEQEKEEEQEDNEILASIESSLSLKSWDLSEEDNEKKDEEAMENAEKLAATSDQQNYGISLPIISPSAITATNNAETANDQINITPDTQNNELSLLQNESKTIKPGEQSKHVHSGSSSSSSNNISSLRSQISADESIESLFN